VLSGRVASTGKICWISGPDLPIIPRPQTLMIMTAQVLDPTDAGANRKVEIMEHRLGIGPHDLVRASDTVISFTSD
jgi:hypothetical protein